MTGLLLKDLFVLKKTISPVYLFPIAMVAFSSSSNLAMMGALLNLVIPLTAAFCVNATLNADEQSNWARYLGALPVRWSVAVLEKYVVSALLLAASLVAMFVVAVPLVAMGQDVRMEAASAVVGLLAAMAYLAILIPSTLRFGIQKASVVFVGFTLLLGAVPSLFRVDPDAIFSAMGTSPWACGVLCVMFVAILVFLSYGLSVRYGRGPLK